MKSQVTALSQWYLRQARKLPWRETRDPYAIWISEVMLQQTQVTTVIPYYERFLTRFPTVEALAESPEDEVLRLWSGLGYYSRAKNLRRAAQHLLARHAGVFPKTRPEMLEVPGIGPYTAGAVLSIAYDLPEPLVDGNVQRVFARFFGIRDFIETRTAQNRFWQEAESWVKQSESPRILNQALMELGATVCTKGDPRCRVCPLREAGCVAFLTRRPTDFPVRKPRRERRDLRWISPVYRADGKFFLRKNPDGQWWAGLWDFPHREAGQESVAEGQVLGTVRHTVTHHRIETTAVLIRAERGALSDGNGGWFAPADIPSLALSSLAKKVLLCISRNSIRGSGLQ